MIYLIIIIFFFQFTDIKNVNITITKQLSKSTKQYQCKCQQIYSDQSKLIFHQKWECGRKINCSSVNCKNIFSTIDDLRHHLKNIHKMSLDYDKITFQRQAKKRNEKRKMCNKKRKEKN